MSKYYETDCRSSLPLEQNDYYIKTAWSHLLKNIFNRQLYFVYTGFNKLSGEGYTTLKFAAIARTVLMFSLFVRDCVYKDKGNNC